MFGFSMLDNVSVEGCPLDLSTTVFGRSHDLSLNG